MAPKNMLAEALAYAEAGYRVLPLYSPRDGGGCTCQLGMQCRIVGKHPRILKWELNASCDPTQVTEWFTKWPNANIGLLSGEATGFFVLDVDAKSGGIESFERLVHDGGPLRDALVQRTGGGGKHCLFGWPGFPVKNIAGAFPAYPGLDTRGDGGYIVVAPSVHASDKVYEWEVGCDPRDGVALCQAPPFLLGLLKPPANKTSGLTRSLQGPVKEGSRNDKVFRHGCGLRACGADAEAVLTGVMAFNTSNCVPPLEDDEVRKIAAQCANYEPGRAGEQAESCFRMDGGKTVFIKPARTADSNPTIVDLAYFEARIVKQIRTFGAGAVPESTYYCIKAKTADYEFPEIDVLASDFQSMSWVPKQLGARAIIAHGNGIPDTLRCAIQTVSQGDIAEVDRFTVLGWRKIGDKWTYIHAGGAFDQDGASKGFEVDIPDKWKRYTLPAPLAGAALVDAIRGSLKFLGIHCPGVTYPLYMGLWRSLLGRPNYTMHVYARTGARKTFIVLDVLKHLGAWVVNENLLRANSTAAALQTAAHEVGDMPLLVDDFKGSFTDREKTIFGAFIQGCGDGSGAGRGNQNMKGGLDRPPRAFVFSTGEQEVPGGESTAARVWQLRAEESPGLIKRGMDWGEAYGAVVAGVTSAYLVSIAGRLDDVRLKHKESSSSWRTELGDRFTGGHARNLSSAADLLAGYEPFLEFCEASGALTPSERAAHLQGAVDQILEVMKAQNESVRSEDPVKMALSLTTSMIASGGAYVAMMDGETCPGDGWGYHQVPLKEGTQHVSSSGARKIGYVDGEYIYLIPEPWFGAIRTECSRSGSPYPLSSKELFKRLAEGKVCEAGGEKDRAAWLTKVAIGDTRPRLIKIRLEKIGRGPVLPEEAGETALCPRKDAQVSQLLDHSGDETDPDPFADDPAVVPIQCEII